MKLYYAAGACSLAPHIVVHEAALAVEPVRVDLRTKKLADGSDYLAINPLGYVPMLELDDGQRLHEAAVILQYLADRAPAGKLIPAAATMERYRALEWLTFVSSELHKSYSPLFNPALPEEAKAIFRTRLLGRYKWLDAQLAGHDYLLGKHFSVCDAYLFAVTSWAPGVGVDISGLNNVSAFMARMQARPAVQATMKAEGLIK
ncbi:MAG: glutathione transferase GstA [Proteobacteria bacterium]|nr:glutathione transferase GstA [Pseudomonadota bacterium]HOL36238.1 glutathione transferase GstA [Rubrivivax sp.]